MRSQIMNGPGLCGLLDYKWSRTDHMGLQIIDCLDCMQGLKKAKNFEKQIT